MKSKITSRDIILPLPDKGETIVILQRNAEDYQGRINQKDLSNETALIGDLLPESITNSYDCAKVTLTDFLDRLSVEDRNQVDFLIIASDPRLGVRNIEHKESLRTINTAKEVLRAVKDIIKKYGLSEEQLINSTATPDCSVVEISEIKEEKTFVDYPELMEFVERKSTETGEDWWNIYEKDLYFEERENLRIEGADSIRKRMYQFMSFVGGGTNYHKSNPNRRLVFWAITHFDTITPYLQGLLKDLNQARKVPPVDFLGGITLHINKTGVSEVFFGEKKSPVRIDYSKSITADPQK